MLSYLRLSKIPEFKQRPIELLPELPLKLMLKSTSTSTKLLTTPLLRLREMPKPMALSLLKENQRLLLSSESEGKYSWL
jgi:hypothetical protein